MNSAQQHPMSITPPSTAPPSLHSFYGPPSREEVPTSGESMDAIQIMPAMPVFPAMPNLSNMPAMPNIPNIPNMPNIPNIPIMPAMPAIPFPSLPLPAPTWSAPSQNYLDANLAATTQATSSAVDALYRAQQQASKTLASQPTGEAEMLVRRSGWADAQGTAAAKSAFNPTLTAQAVHGYRSVAKQARITKAAFKAWSDMYEKDLDKVALCADAVARCEMDTWVASMGAQIPYQ
ncbi:hypothetical protein CspHIS471_0308770 [Cutaneotrichosporon sp. HIS471]|nr:hypothetical protein CspHIS471_0308770 [Cutaneotrichosporon sp. HIS471]